MNLLRLSKERLGSMNSMRRRYYLWLGLVALTFTKTAWAQDPQTKLARPAAPISCSSKVEASACKWAEGAFIYAQRTSTAMRSVEVVIDDSAAFQRERDRIGSISNNLLKANPSAAERGKLTLQSPFDSSILFELGEGGIISKVVVRVDLFNQANLSGTPAQNGPPVAEFDRDSAMTWATYIMGYVEGCMRSRAHILAEATEQAR